jgi:hypothetical protein
MRCTHGLIEKRSRERLRKQSRRCPRPSMPKRVYKHKLLLDENMPPRTAFLLLNSQFDVKHLVVDLRHGGLTDPEVYQLAVEQKRILVTYNTKHFRPLAGRKKGYPLKAGQLGYDCRYSTMHGMPVTGGRGFRGLKPWWYNSVPP